MKNKLCFFASLSVLAFWSCNSDPDIIVPTTTVIEDNGKPFIATTESYSPETKTSLNNGNVLWKTGDQVSIFAASTINDQYQVTDGSNGKTSASLNKISPSGFVAGVELDDNVAYYPFSASNEVAKNGSDYDLTVSLPSTQNYAENSFGNGAFPMAAVTDGSGDMNLTFKNVLGGLKLQLKGTATISRITVTGNNNEILYGDATVTVSKNTVPSIVLSNASAKVITLDCGAGVALDAETATSFVIALPPMTMTGGFTIDIYDIFNGHQQVSSTKSQTIVRSNLLVMPAINYVGVIPPPFGYVDLGLPSGIMWANMNLGASSPEEYGNYYAWGEIEIKNHYLWSNYVFGDWRECLTKYNITAEFGNIDNLTVLESVDDVAHVTLGTKWRIPTLDEGKELLSNCTWEITTYNNVPGYVATSKINGNSIFFPFAGYFEDVLIQSEVGRTGRYWLSSLCTGSRHSSYNCTCAFRLSLRSADLGSSRDWDWYDRNAGLSIRPVYDSLRQD